MFVESMLETLIIHLESVNVGELRSRETSEAITNLEIAQLWLAKRKMDREARSVLGTYQK